MYRSGQNSDMVPLNGGIEYRWCIRNRDCRPIYRYMLETTVDRHIVTMED